jgi:RsiW-degrading membrane proteinase PrsW (M82 family)
VSAHPAVRIDYGYDLARQDPNAPEQLTGGGRTPLRRRRPWVQKLVWSLAIAALLLVFVGVYFLTIRPMGLGTSLVAATCALVPVSIVITAVWWLNRYTPQPRITLVYAFVWGIAGAVGLTFVIGGAFTTWITPDDANETVSEFIGAVIQAPIVEESMKSAGLIALLIWGRRFISGPIDGVVYAALIGGGFAFTENILYFGQAFTQAQAAGTTDAFWQTFLLRGLLSPFAHVSFTSLCGLALGIAAERRALMLYFGLGAGGLSLGMCLHALWNGSTFLIQVDPAHPMAGFLRYYLTVQVPIFVLLAGIMAFLRLRERRIVRRHLSDYGRAGWFAPNEVDVLVSMRGRRRAERWAGGHGQVARTAMHDLILAAVELAMNRQGDQHGRPTHAARAREHELLARITADRRMIGALTRPVVPTSMTP